MDEGCVMFVCVQRWNKGSVSFRLHFLRAYVKCGNLLFATKNFKPVFYVFSTWNDVHNGLPCRYKITHARSTFLYDSEDI